MQQVGTSNVQLDACRDSYPGHQFAGLTPRPLQLLVSDQRQMGLETHFEAVIEHPELGTVTWGVWEYPQGVENYKNSDASEHTVVNDFDYGLT